jgi:hypothetical protein
MEVKCNKNLLSPYTVEDGGTLAADTPEPVLLNVYGAQESIPRNEFRQPM